MDLKSFFFAAKILHREYPYRIYLPITLVCLLISLFNFLSIYKEFLVTGIVPRLPTLLISSSLFLSSILFMFVGIILNSIDNIRYEQRKIGYLLTTRNEE